jgi:subtilisin family serine protease
MTGTRKRLSLVLALVAILGGGAASAQILPGGGPQLPPVNAPGVGLPDVPDAPGRLPAVGDLTQGLDPSRLTDQRGLGLQKLLRANRDQLDTDDAGNVIVRDEMIAIAPSPEALAAAARAGFTVARQTALPDLGLTAVVLKPPTGVSARKGLKALRKMDPLGTYDVNPIYTDAGGASGPATASHRDVLPPPTANAGGARIGLLDGGVATGHPALAGAHVIAQAFAPGGLKPGIHGTAVASLMVGRQGAFSGAAPGATLFAADVYGGAPTGGSAEIIARALAWMARERPSVVNISLVGPPNGLLQAAVSALLQKGVMVVAAVGNDGPAAPALYPAAYPGVIAVTGVDRNRRPLLEASRNPHTDFAAPAADMAAAGLSGFVIVRGTSFAAPLVAGRLAVLAQAGPGAVDRLAGDAADLGARGRDPVFGRGLVCEDLRTAPNAVQARAWKGG